jgi:hypothetical protein
MLPSRSDQVGAVVQRTILLAEKRCVRSPHSSTIAAPEQIPTTRTYRRAHATHVRGWSMPVSMPRARDAHHLPHGSSTARAHSRGIAEHAAYTDPLRPCSAVAPSDQFVAAAQTRFASLQFSLGGAIDAHHNQARE